MERRFHSEKCAYDPDDPQSFCGLCYENRKGRAAHKGHRYYSGRVIRRVQFWEYQMQRPSQAPRPKKGEFACCDTVFKSTYPLLCAGMCDPWWDDGKPREPWTLKISMNDQQVMLTVNDKDSKLVAFTSAEALVEGLEAIETALESGGLSWRKSKW